jgi:hypothetical protein
MGEVGLLYHQYHIDQPANYWAIKAAVAANYRPFASLDSPYFKFSLAARRSDYRNDFQPDRNVRLKLSLNKQWTPAVLAFMGVAFREGYYEWPTVDTVNASHWDTSRTKLFAGMDLRISDLIFYGQISRYEGDLIWTDSQGESYIGDIWRDDSVTDKLELGINIPVSSQAAVDILGSFNRTSFQGRDMYDETTLSVAYLHRFSF